VTGTFRLVPDKWVNLFFDAAGRHKVWIEKTSSMMSDFKIRRQNQCTLFMLLLAFIMPAVAA